MLQVSNVEQNLFHDKVGSLIRKDVFNDDL